MDIFGNVGSNPFDQALNTYDNVDFTRVDVTDAIVDNSQLATKLYVDNNSGGNMTYVGTTPATNYIYKALASDGQDAVKSSIIDDGSTVTIAPGVYGVIDTIKTSDINTLAFNGTMSIGNSFTGNMYLGRPTTNLTINSDSVVANSFIKSGGTNIQYLMGDGSTLTQSATSGNSNFYLYKSINGVTTPPPLSGDVGYNNSNQSLATIVYISHLTRDNIDIEVFYNQVNQLNDLYIQDQNNSVNFIKYNITGTPTSVINSYISIPVLTVSSGGTGSTSFGSNHNVLLAFFSNLSEVDTRLSTLETKTFNQTASVGTTTISGTLTADFFIKSGGLNTEFLKADGNIDSNTYLSQSGLYNPTGLGNIDIMLRDSPFIGLQYNNGTAVSTLSNSLFSAVSSTAVTTSTYGTTNNFTRQLCCANWSTISLANGAGIGYISNITNGCRVSSGFNFGLSAVLGISDSNYNANNCQNFWGVAASLVSLPLDQSIQLSVQRNIIGFGSDTNDPNICIYTGGASNTVKQVDLGASFPANRPTVALGASTDFFKFTLYWEGSTIYYKAVNTTTHVIVSGSFIPLATDMPLASLVLLPQCIRIMGSPQVSGQAKLQVQRFGVYYN